MALAFLIVLLAEWGSHGMIHTSQSTSDDQSISATEGGHDDPCRFLVLCSDSGRKDRQMARFGHEVMHNGLLDLVSASYNEIGVTHDALIPFAGAHGLSRPPDPSFHPPENS